MTDYSTNITSETNSRDPVTRRFWVTVIGRGGTFHGVRDTFVEARSTAIHYARLFDAPREVLDDGREI